MTEDKILRCYWGWLVNCRCCCEILRSVRDHSLWAAKSL